MTVYWHTTSSVVVQCYVVIYSVTVIGGPASTDRFTPLWQPVVFSFLLIFLLCFSDKLERESVCLMSTV